VSGDDLLREAFVANGEDAALPAGGERWVHAEERRRDESSELGVEEPDRAAVCAGQARGLLDDAVEDLGEFERRAGRLRDFEKDRRFECALFLRGVAAASTVSDRHRVPVPLALSEETRRRARPEMTERGAAPENTRTCPETAGVDGVLALMCEDGERYHGQRPREEAS
jgi:hypothetical protein